MSSYNKKSLEDKLHRLNSSQESVETLSHWIIHHKQYAEDSVRIWKEFFKESEPEKRLLLFYLTNDVLQNGRRKGINLFHSVFKPHLLDAALFVSGQKIQTSIERIFKIWKERKVFDKKFVDELKKRITMGPHTVVIKLPTAENLPIRDVPDFKASTLCDALDDMQKFESDLHVKASVMSKMRLDVADTRSLSLLKDKSAGGKFLNEFNENCSKLQDYCDTLAAEVDARKDIIHLLTDAYTSCTASISQLVQTIKEYKDAAGKIDQLNVMFEMRLQSCADPGSGVHRRDVITEEVDMELDSDEEIDAKLDRAYENSRKQASLRDVLSGEIEPALTVASSATPQLDTLSLLKAIADTGTLISPALKTQLELIQQNKPSVLQAPNTGFMPNPENTQLKCSVEDKLNKLIEQKAAFTSLQNQALLSNLSVPLLKHEPNVPQYVDTLISPNFYKSNNPASGQSTPLLDEAPDTEDKKQTPDQYNQFASYTQGLYKPIESSPIENNISKDANFLRDFYTPNETKKQRLDSPITLNMKVIDYKHGTSVRPATSIPPPPPNETQEPLIPPQIPFEPPQNTRPFIQPPIQPNSESPYPRPMMNPQHNIQMPPPPPFLNQPHLPFQQPIDNNMPPNRVPENKSRHESILNNQHMPPMHEQDMRKSNEYAPVFHGHHQPPRPSHPHFFRPPPPPHFAPSGNRPMPPYDFRPPPPPNELPHRYPPPPGPHPHSYSHNTRPRNFQGHNH